MKTTLKLIFIFSVLAGGFSCESINEQEANVFEECNMPLSDPFVALNCGFTSFMEGAAMYSKCSNCFVIKGIALETNEYGLNIQFVEDLKGNFPENVNTFIAWGDDSNFNAFCVNRWDDLTIYNNQDVLIMLLTPARDWSDMIPEYTWLEKAEDYTTLSCTFSVLKLSDGYVTGHILPFKELETTDTLPVDNMTWKEFQTRLNKIFKKK
jgi:hypothetical protein